jgi:hypothetical protein
VFSHDRWHKPRRFQRSRDKVDGQRVKVMAAHFPTNGFSGGNRAPFGEAAAKAALFLRSGLPGTVNIVVGDLNEKVDKLRPWAKLVGATVAGHNVDACVVRGGGVKAETLPKFGSDHHAMRYTITRKG